MDDDRKVLHIVRITLSDEHSHELDIMCREEGKTRMAMLREMLLSEAARVLAEPMPTLS